MEVLIGNYQRIYRFYEEYPDKSEKELIGEITVKLYNDKKVRVMKINFKQTFQKIKGQYEAKSQRQQKYK